MSDDYSKSEVKKDEIENTNKSLTVEEATKKVLTENVLLEVNERKADFETRHNYINNANRMINWLLILAILASTTLFVMYVGRNYIVYSLFKDYSSVFQTCANMEASNQDTKKKTNNKKTDKNSACTAIYGLTAAFNGPSSLLSYTQLIYLNIVLYSACLFLMISVQRVRFVQSNNDHPSAETTEQKENNISEENNNQIKENSVNDLPGVSFISSILKYFKIK